MEEITINVSMFPLSDKQEREIMEWLNSVKIPDVSMINAELFKKALKEVDLPKTIAIDLLANMEHKRKTRYVNKYALIGKRNK